MPLLSHADPDRYLSQPEGLPLHIGLVSECDGRGRESRQVPRVCGIHLSGDSGQHPLPAGETCGFQGGSREHLLKTG